MVRRGHCYRGLWITFESGEGAGKGTHQKLLAEYLGNEGYVVKSGREPGTTPAGEEIRKILQDPDKPKLNPRTEMLLYIAAGIEYFEQHVKPTLKSGSIFLSDRWRDSTMAYQGYGLGLDLDTISRLTKFSCDGAYPDLTFLIDIDAEKGLKKLTGNEFSGNKLDKIESRKLEYHKKVNQGYREIGKESDGRVIIIPYKDGHVEEMQSQIRNHVKDYIFLSSLKSELAKV